MALRSPASSKRRSAARRRIAALFTDSTGAHLARRTDRRRITCVAGAGAQKATAERVERLICLVEQLLSDVEHVCEGDERLISRAELLIFDDDLLSSDVEQL